MTRRTIYLIKNPILILNKKEIKLIDLSSKQMAGKLRNIMNSITSKASFAIFRSSSNQWING
jgi:hypothetical protein